MLSEGETVRPGDPIARLRSPSIDAEIAVARAFLESQKERALATRQSLRQRDAILVTEIAAAERAVEQALSQQQAASAAVAAARKTHDAVSSLATPKFTTLGEISAVRKERAEAEGLYTAASAQLDDARARLTTARAGYFYGDARSTGDDPAQLRRDLRVLEKEITTQDARLQSLLARQRALTLNSTCECIVMEFSRKPGEYINEGAPLVRFHQQADGARVTAFVRHQQTRHFNIGAKATVRLTDGLVDHRAVIESIQTDLKLRSEQRLAFRDLDPERFTEVTVRLSDDFPNAPSGGAQVTLIWPAFRWLQQVFYFSI